MQFARATALFWAAAAAQSVPAADADDGQSPRRLLMMDDFDFNNGFNNDFNNNIYQDDLMEDLDLPNLDGGYIPPPDDTPSCKYPAPSPPLPCGTGAYEGWYDDEYRLSNPNCVQTKVSRRPSVEAAEQAAAAVAMLSAAAPAAAPAVATPRSSPRADPTLLVAALRPLDGDETTTAAATDETAADDDDDDEPDAARRATVTFRV